LFAEDRKIEPFVTSAWLFSVFQCVHNVVGKIYTSLNLADSLLEYLKLFLETSCWNIWIQHFGK